jgi:hypothetical protein
MHFKSTIYLYFSFQNGDVVDRNTILSQARDIKMQVTGKQKVFFSPLTYNTTGSNLLSSHSFFW